MFDHYCRRAALSIPDLLVKLSDEGFDYRKSAVYLWRDRGSTGPAHPATVRAIAMLLSTGHNDFEQVLAHLTGK